MAYTLLTSTRVEKELNALPPLAYQRVKRAPNELCENPRPDTVRKLQGRPNTYRVRVGDYRILYAVDDDAQEIRLKAIGDRKDVYR